MRICEELFGPHNLSQELSDLVISEVKQGEAGEDHPEGAEILHCGFYLPDKDLVGLPVDQRYAKYMLPSIKSIANACNAYPEITAFELNVPGIWEQDMAGCRSYNHLGGKIPVRVMVSYSIDPCNCHLVSLDVLARLT